jgi:hypothetical protein
LVNANELAGTIEDFAAKESQAELIGQLVGKDNIDLGTNVANVDQGSAAQCFALVVCEDLHDHKKVEKGLAVQALVN